MTSDARPGRIPNLPRWMPIGDEPELCNAGQWWDAVRINEAEGRRAIELLRAAGVDIGPVILDAGGREPRLYFLVPVGTAAAWHEADTVPLGQGCHVVVPPSTRAGPPGLHWQHFPHFRQRLTQSDPLRHALAKARREAAAGRTDTGPGS